MELFLSLIGEKATTQMGNIVFPSYWFPGDDNGVFRAEDLNC